MSLMANLLLNLTLWRLIRMGEESNQPAKTKENTMKTNTSGTAKITVFRIALITERQELIRQEIELYSLV